MPSASALILFFHVAEILIARTIQDLTAVLFGSLLQLQMFICPGVPPYQQLSQHHLAAY